MNTNVQPDISNKIIRPLKDRTVLVLLDNIITLDRTINIGLQGIIIEGIDIIPIEIIDISFDRSYLYLTIKNQATNTKRTIIHTKYVEDNEYNWWLISYSYLVQHIIDRLKGLPN